MQPLVNTGGMAFGVWHYSLSPENHGPYFEITVPGNAEANLDAYPLADTPPMRLGVPYLLVPNGHGLYVPMRIHNARFGNGHNGDGWLSPANWAYASKTKWY